MKITVEISDYRDPENGSPCEVGILTDKEGIEYLIVQLSSLIKNEKNDHLHLMTDSWGEGSLSEKIYDSRASLVHHLKVSLIE